MKKNIQKINNLTENEIIELETNSNNDNNAFINEDDCLYWGAYSYWKLFDAACLLHGLDPRRSTAILTMNRNQTRTCGFRIIDIVNSYNMRYEFDEIQRILVEDESIADPRYREIYGDEYCKTTAVVPKEFLAWAKGKGFSVPQKLWSAVFYPQGTNGIDIHHAVTDNKTKRKAKKERQAGEKDPERVADGEKTYQGIRNFKSIIKKFVVEEKARGCTCNHLWLAAYIKSVWPSFLQNFGNENPKSLYRLRKEPIEYVTKSCLEAFVDNDWPIVKNKSDGRKKCVAIPQHNDIGKQKN